MVASIGHIVLQHQITRDLTVAVAKRVHLEFNPELTAFRRDHCSGRGKWIALIQGSRKRDHQLGAAGQVGQHLFESLTADLFQQIAGLALKTFVHPLHHATSISHREQFGRVGSNRLQNAFG